MKKEEINISFNELLEQGFKLDVVSDTVYRLIVSKKSVYYIKVLEYKDKLFRLNSAVVLPECEMPVDGSSQPQKVSPLGIAATVLKYLYENNSTASDESQMHTILVTGHTDTAGNLEYNRKLSAWRAENVLAIITGNGLRFAEICSGWDRMRISDYKQILAWLARTRNWDCDPGVIDDNDNNAAVNRFRKTYNADGPGSTWAEPITEWGASNTPEVWKAYFNCYQEYIAAELGTDVDGLEKYRSAIRYASPGQWVGCNEYHPRVFEDVDDLREQQNRRVEVLFFDPGEAPDALACSPNRSACNKDQCLLYDDKKYQKVPLPQGGIGGGTTSDRLIVFLYDDNGMRMPGANYRLMAGTTYQGQANDKGCVEVDLLVCPDKSTLEWGPISSGGSYTYATELYIDCGKISGTQLKGRRMLSNMGYPVERDLNEAVMMFEMDHFLPPNGCTEDGKIPDATCIEIEKHYVAASTV